MLLQPSSKGKIFAFELGCNSIFLRRLLWPLRKMLLQPSSKAKIFPFVSIKRKA